MEGAIAPFAGFNPVPLPLEGVCRQGYTTPLLVSIESDQATSRLPATVAPRRQAGRHIRSLVLRLTCRTKHNLFSSLVGMLPDEGAQRPPRSTSRKIARFPSARLDPRGKSILFDVEPGPVIRIRSFCGGDPCACEIGKVRNLREPSGSLFSLAR